MTEPKFITWKKYGFRHIEKEASHYEKKIYTGDVVQYYMGKSLCGNRFHVADPPYESYGSTRPNHDIRAKDRPLCGSCKKKWKKLTGKDLI